MGTIQGNTNSIAISLPIEMVERIDKERGDISRSRYFMRMVEKHFEGKKK